MSSQCSCLPRPAHNFKSPSVLVHPTHLLLAKLFPFPITPSLKVDAHTLSSKVISQFAEFYLSSYILSRIFYKSSPHPESCITSLYFSPSMQHNFFFLFAISHSELNSSKNIFSVSSFCTSGFSFCIVVVAAVVICGCF